MGPKCLTCAGSATCYAATVLETVCAAMLSGLAGSKHEDPMSIGGPTRCARAMLVELLAAAQSDIRWSLKQMKHGGTVLIFLQLSL
jgi:hypothetical protein